MLALLLLLNIKPIVLRSILLIKHLIHILFQVVWPIVIYLTLVIEIDIVFRFLLYYETTAPLKKNVYFITDFLLLRSLIRLLLLYCIKPQKRFFNVRLLFGFQPYINFSCIILFKYCKTLLAVQKQLLQRFALCLLNLLITNAILDLIPQAKYMSFFINC